MEAAFMRANTTVVDAVEGMVASELQCSRQWSGFLGAMKQEFLDALPAQDLKRLMVRVGCRFAQAHPLDQCETLQELQYEMNRVWSQCDWGHVGVSQTDSELLISHQLSPLSAAFGHEDAEWATGYLLGVYQQWFDAAGAVNLRVEETALADFWGTAQFRLIGA